VSCDNSDVVSSEDDARVGWHVDYQLPSHGGTYDPHSDAISSDGVNDADQPLFITSQQPQDGAGPININAARIPSAQETQGIPNTLEQTLLQEVQHITLQTQQCQ